MKKPVSALFASALLMASTLVALSLVQTSHALAADVVFPPGLRVGLVPLPGLEAAPDFTGFQSADKALKVGVLEIPEAAFAAFETAAKDGQTIGAGVKPETFESAAGKSYLAIESGKDGDDPVRSFSLVVAGDKYTGYVIAQIRNGAEKNYPDDAIRKMLATTVTRKEVPVAEQLAQLPFKVTELGGFKTVRSLAQQTSVLLTDGTEDATLDSSPYMVIGFIPVTADTPDEKARLAEQVATTIPGLRESRITSSEPIRIDSGSSFETRISGVTGKNDTPISVVQWLRFGGSATLRIIASSRREEWADAFPRFRAVRDGVQPRDR